MKKLLAFGSVALVGALALTACNNDKGDAQKVGEKIDNTYQDAKTSINKLNEGPVEQAGKKIDDATNNT